MDDIQNLLYLAILVIWFLSRVFGKKKQKPKPVSGTPGPNQDSKSAPEPPPVTFEDILRELTGGSTKEEPAPYEEEYVSDEVEYQEEDDGHEYEPIAPDPVILTPQPVEYEQRAFKQFRIKSSRGSKSARKVRKLLQSRNGLKQAIILKEILDRPYS